MNGHRVIGMGNPEWNSLLMIPLGRHTSLPAHERVLDRLADLLFDADEVLDMLRAEDASSVRWIEPVVRKAYDEVNDVMKRLCN